MANYQWHRFTIGAVVRNNNPGPDDPKPPLGHIVGFSANDLNELLLIVDLAQTADDPLRVYMHPANVTLLGS